MCKNQNETKLHRRSHGFGDDKVWGSAPFAGYSQVYRQNLSQETLTTCDFCAVIILRIVLTYQKYMSRLACQG